MGPKKEPAKVKKSAAAGKDKPIAPKKKKGKADKAGDEDKSAPLSPKEMKVKMESLEADKIKEEQERNFVQLERDKIASFLEIKKKELEQAKVELRVKDRHLEELEERHQDEIKVYNQKMKHLLYEQYNNIAAAKAEHEVALKLLREQTAKREMELLSEQLGLKEKIRELELAYEDTIKQVKLDHGKELTKMKQEYDANEKELQSKTEKKLKNERDDLHKQFEMGVFELQQKSNLKNLLIQRKVQVLEETLEKKDAQLGEVAALGNRDPNTVQIAKDNINHTIDSKNKEIRQLRYELGKMTKAYKDLSNAFKTKLVQYGVPLEEMGLPYYMS